MAHFAHQDRVADSNDSAPWDQISDLPPDTYTVRERATVKSLQFTLSDKSNVAPGNHDGQSLGASLGVEMPHVSALATSVSLSPQALTAVTTIQKQAIAAAAKSLFGASLTHRRLVINI